MSQPETLESFISARFTALALSIPEDDVSQDFFPHHSSSCELPTQENVWSGDPVIFAHVH